MGKNWFHYLAKLNNHGFRQPEKDIIHIMNDTKSLLAFAAVLRHGSMHAAADALGTTPSAVSQHISKLEQSHGVKLLKRSTRHLSPTDAGAVLAEHCLRLQTALHDAQTALENVKTEAAGDVRLACPSALVAAPAFQAALLCVAEKFPLIRIQLMVADALADLQTAQIDIAVRGGEMALNAPDLVARHLVDWQWQIVATPAYLQDKSLHTPDDLLNVRWLNVLPVRHELRRGAESYLLDVRQTWHCGDLAALRHLTLAGLGVSVQLSGDIAQEIRSGSLKIVLPEWTLPSVALYAVTPHRVQSAKVAAVLSCLQNSFAAKNA